MNFLAIVYLLPMHKLVNLRVLLLS